MEVAIKISLSSTEGIAKGEITEIIRLESEDRACWGKGVLFLCLQREGAVFGSFFRGQSRLRTFFTSYSDIG